VQEGSFGQAWAMMLVQAAVARGAAGYRSTPTRSLNGREQRRAGGDYRTLLRRRHDAAAAAKDEAVQP